MHERKKWEEDQIIPGLGARLPAEPDFSDWDNPEDEEGDDEKEPEGDYEDEDSYVPGPEDPDYDLSEAAGYAGWEEPRRGMDPRLGDRRGVDPADPGAARAAAAQDRLTQGLRKKRVSLTDSQRAIGYQVRPRLYCLTRPDQDPIHVQLAEQKWSQVEACRQSRI